MNAPLAEILKKLTIKDVMGEGFEPKDITEPRDLIQIIGVVNSVVPDSTNYGEYFSFVGAFEALRMDDGVIFTAPKCILPEPIGTMMGQQLTSIVAPEDVSEEETGEGATKRKRKRYKVPAAQFGVILGVKPSKKGARGYEWTSKPVIQPKQVDALADLRSVMRAQMPALEGPKTAASAGTSTAKEEAVKDDKGKDKGSKK